MQTTEKIAHSIGILCPTRKRVVFLDRYIQSILTCADNPQRCTFHFFLDEDDPDTKKYLDDRIAKDNLRVKYQIHAHGSVVLSDMWNKLYETCDDEIVMISGDDAIMRSPHWDSSVAGIFDQVPDKICLVYGRDGIHDQKFATQFFLHRNWIETAGYIFPKCYTADWADTWVFEVSKMLQRSIFIPDIFLEHMHWSVGKSDMDETALLAQARRGNDNNEYRFRSPEHFFERLELVKKLYIRMWNYAVDNGARK